MSKLLVRSKKSRSCKLTLLVIIGATFVFNMAISSIQKNFHSPVDPPNQSQRPQHPQLYTAELAAKAVEPTVWTCGKADRQKGGVVDPITNQRPFFAFIHVYKTGGSSVRKFLQEYATTCEKSLALVGKCKYYEASVDIGRCKLSKSKNVPQSIESVNSTILHDHYDILGGHFSFGMADDVFPNATATPDNAASQVRHMVFLRQPMTKFVSHVLYQQKQWNQSKMDTLEETVKDIKKRVWNFRNNGEYMGSLKFPQSPYIFAELLTPEQVKMTDNLEETVEEVMVLKTQLAIDNLMRYNTVVGMTETLPRSIKILEHTLGQIVDSTSKKKEVQDFFIRYTGEDAPKANSSKRGSISTDSVLKDLNKDKKFMTIFREFVKYEQMIVDFAMDMHQKQYEAVKKGHFERYTSENILAGLEEASVGM